MAEESEDFPKSKSGLDAAAVGTRYFLFHDTVLAPCWTLISPPCAQRKSKPNNLGRNPRDFTTSMPTAEFQATMFAGMHPSRSASIPSHPVPNRAGSAEDWASSRNSFSSYSDSGSSQSALMSDDDEGCVPEMQGDYQPQLHSLLANVQSREVHREAMRSLAVWQVFHTAVVMRDHQSMLDTGAGPQARRPVREKPALTIRQTALLHRLLLLLQVHQRFV